MLGKAINANNAKTGVVIIAIRTHEPALRPF